MAQRGQGRPRKRPGRSLYYANAWISGTRLRQCLDTDDYATALSRQKALIKNVEANPAASSTVNREWLKYTIAEALDALIEDRERDGKAERTLRIDRERSRPLKRLLGEKPVRKFGIADIREYRNNRRKEGMANRTVNMETTLLRLILKAAGRWARLGGIPDLRESRDVVGRVLTPEEKLRLFRTARSREEWSRAYLAAVVDVPSDVMMKLAGHMSEKMRQHYIHVREQATKKAVALLPGTGLDTGLGSMDTTLVTLDTKTPSKPS